MTSPLTKKEIEKLIEEKLKDLATFYSVTELATKSEIKELIDSMNKKFDAVDKRFEAVDKRFEELIDSMNKRFEAVDKRFEAVDKRFEAVDKRFEELIDSMNKRFEAVDKRFEAIDKRFEAVDKRFEELIDSMNKRFEAVDKRFEAVDKRFEELIAATNRRFDKVFDRFNDLSIALGHDFEEFNSYWLETFLIAEGYPKIDIQKKTFIDEEYQVFSDTKNVEIDLFNEDPLVIGEVTAITRKISKITTFLRKIKFLESKFGKAKHKLFITYNIKRDIREEGLRLLTEADVTIFILRKKED